MLALISLPYTRNRWSALLRQLFDQYEERGTPLDIPVPESSLAVSINQLGTVTIQGHAEGETVSLAVIEIVASDAVALLRNRVGIRNLAARLISPGTADGLLVATTQPGHDAWRFTFVHRETRFTEEGDLVRIETPARRFTYVLGPDESCRTPDSRFQLLARHRGQTTLAHVLDAFSVEKLSDEFFATYKRHYADFCNHLIENSDLAHVLGIEVAGLEGKERDRALKPIRDFVKKLLGRLVFLHFIQKKGWLGCPPLSGADAALPQESMPWAGGDSDFLRGMFQSTPPEEQACFHSSRLVPLFFQTLNAPDRPGLVFPITGTRVPYLNGGLFETDFPGVEAVDFPAPLFDALLEFFRQYHFTIDENDPEDHEIGIDPEMLGRIFENLLEDNKDKGAYYTPKPVVQYMCQQSLIHALTARYAGDAEAPAEIERLVRNKDPIDVRQNSWLARNATDLSAHLDDLRICDPAIGSGAFPIGLLQEIYWIKLTLNPSLDRAHAKRSIIQHCIHGVDLDAGAVEIARLRFWLALIVDEDVPTPLPNLDYQIMQGNSLLESFEGEPLDKLAEPVRAVGRQRLGSDAMELDLGGSAAPGELTVTIHTPAQHNFAELREEYYACHDPTEKAALRARIDAAVLHAIDARLTLRRDELQTAIDNSNREIVRKRSIKRNYQPSAREAKALGKMQAEMDALEGKSSRLHALLENPRSERPFFLWHLWFRQILADAPEGRGGFDIVIANPPYISAIDYKNAFGDDARNLLKSGYVTATGAWDIYILFFELTLHLLNSSGVACFINPNKYLAAPYAQGLRKHILDHGVIHELVDVSQIRTFRQVSVYPVITFFGRNMFAQGGIRVLSPIEQREQDFDIGRFRDRIVEPRFLRLLPEYIWGFLLSEHYMLLDNIVSQTRPLQDCGQVNATSTAAEADAYGRHFVDDSTVSWRLVNTGLIERYECLWGRHRLIHQGRQLIHPALPDTAPVSINRRTLYNSQKIIFAKMASQCEAFIDLNGEYASVNTNCFYSPRDGVPLQFFAAIFNSQMFMFIYELYFGALRMAGGDYQWGSPQLRLVPIPTATPVEQSILSGLVDAILAAKRAGDEAAVADLEAQIDRHVFRLYGLTPEEIALVQGG